MYWAFSGISSRGVLHRPDRRDGVDGRADPADPLRVDPRLAGIPPLQDDLDPRHIVPDDQASFTTPRRPRRRCGGALQSA